ncbi:MAG: hypothetical protein DMF71_12905 [Acidobacteria bacterium]|nr:MAG: hypothetical protein DMF71_12905 [Acidobacteriota bacterium]
MHKAWIEIAALILAVLCAMGVLLNKQAREKGIGPRTLQGLIVSIVGPVILILGLEKVLTAETIAALVGAMIGYVMPKPGKESAGKEV